MSGTRGILIGLAVVAILLGIFAAADNFLSGQVGWNTTFTIIQTIVVAALMVIVARDGSEQNVD